MLKPDKIPESLKALRQWCCWKTIKRDRPTKVPFQIGGKPASSTDPKTWSDFGDALAAANRFDGIGFVFAADRKFFGVDLDGCRNPETGEVAWWAKEIVLLLDSYAEVSPSLTGIKVYCRGSLPIKSGKKIGVDAERMTPDKEPAIEAYDHGRYFAVTGWKLQGTPAEPQERTEEVKRAIDTYFKPREQAAAQGEFTSSLSVIERARKYLDQVPAAISGQGGHNACFHAACVLLLGFELTQDAALVLLSEYNQRCKPPWSERELRHKIQSAAKQPGQRGYLRDARPSSWNDIPCPQYTDPSAHKEPKPGAKIVTLESAAMDYLSAMGTGSTDLVSLGIGELDYAIGGGVAFGEMVIVAARPSHGKTAFAMQCLDAFCQAGYPSAMVSEEMSAMALGRRAIQFVAETPEEHWEHQVDNLRGTISDHYREQAPCYIVEACRTADAAAAAIVKLSEEKGVRCVAVDYAQLLTGKGKSRYEQITSTSIALRQAANKTGVLLIVLCQLNREIESRNKFVPKMADLKDTGQLEQDADVVMFLVWPHKITPKKTSKEVAEFQIWAAKNRNRGINQHFVQCEFRPNRLRIVEAPIDAGQPIEAWNGYEATADF